MRWRPRRSLCRPGSRCEAWQDGRHLRAAQRGPRLMEGQYERVSQSRELLYSVPAALCERGHGAAEHSGLGFLQGAWKSPFLHVFACFVGGATERQKWRRGAPPPLFLVFGAHSKAVSLNAKNGEEGHRAFFCHFCGALKSGATKRQKWRRGAPPPFFLVFGSKAVAKKDTGP